MPSTPPTSSSSQQRPSSGSSNGLSCDNASNKIDKDSNAAVVLELHSRNSEKSSSILAKSEDVPVPSDDNIKIDEIKSELEKLDKMKVQPDARPASPQLGNLLKLNGQFLSAPTELIEKGGEGP